MFSYFMPISLANVTFINQQMEGEHKLIIIQISEYVHDSFLARRSHKGQQTE